MENEEVVMQMLEQVQELQERLQEVELPALISLGIANEYTLLHVRSKARSLVLLHMHIGSAPPHSKVGDVRLSPMPQFIKSSASDSLSRASVPHMDEGVSCC
jgi:hypothetical protein